MRRRVVVTGMGVVSPLGSELGAIEVALREGKSGVRKMTEWAHVKHMLTAVGAPADVPQIHALPRKVSRLMGRVALLATVATERAIADAQLTTEEVRSGKIGLAPTAARTVRRPRTRRGSGSSSRRRGSSACRRPRTSSS